MYSLQTVQIYITLPPGFEIVASNGHNTGQISEVTGKNNFETCPKWIIHVILADLLVCLFTWVQSLAVQKYMKWQVKIYLFCQKVQNSLAVNFSYLCLIPWLLFKISWLPVRPCLSGLVLNVHVSGLKIGLDQTSVYTGSFWNWSASKQIQNWTCVFADPIIDLLGTIPEWFQNSPK